LFLFYLGLGHITRITHLPALLVFHLARLVSSGLLLWALWVFWGGVFERADSRKLAFALSVLGSGSGWLLVASGAFTADFWVAEGYPFLSMYANPHFPLGLALVLMLIRPTLEPMTGWKNWALQACGGLFLSIVNPFGVVIVLMVMGGNWLFSLLRGEAWLQAFKRLLITATTGLPLLVYDLWVANHDPVLRNWNAQNLTPSPSWWDLLVSLSPGILVGIWGLFAWVKAILRPGKAPDATIVVWLVTGLVAMYLPLGLQRRFMMGLFVPVAGLAALGLGSLRGKKRLRNRLGGISLLILSLPTNLMILLSALGGIQALDARIYLSRAERQALEWISTQTRPDDIILASPEMGTFIPAYTGRRVLYGHPFETVDAAQQEALVRAFFKQGDQAEAVAAFMADKAVSYVFLGARESALGDVVILDGWELDYQDGEVRVYRVVE
jgi:hypothetical protein